MVCPLCSAPKTQVYNSRSTTQESRVWRRRQCPHCKQAFTTYEAFDLSYILVGKRRGDNEPYQRMKLYVSVYKALEEPSVAESCLLTIELKLLRMKSHIVSSASIAGLVASTLRSISGPGYARYLSYLPESLRKDMLGPL